MLMLFVILLISYLLGSIPTSIIVCKLVKGVDPRDYGSGNAGGTNVSRILGWKYGLLVIFLDALKGAIAVIFVARLFYGAFPFENRTPFDDFTLVQILAGLAAVIGHIWTIFAGFRGGKGIATSLGILISIITIDMVIALAIFILVVSMTKYISLGSILAGISVPIIMIIRENVFHAHINGYGTLLPFAILLSLLVIYTHRKNISRLYKGEESKISFGKK